MTIIETSIATRDAANFEMPLFLLRAVKLNDQNNNQCKLLR